MHQPTSTVFVDYPLVGVFIAWAMGSFIATGVYHIAWEEYKTHKDRKRPNAVRWTLWIVAWPLMLTYNFVWHLCWLFFSLYCQAVQYPWVESTIRQLLWLKQAPSMLVGAWATDWQDFLEDAKMDPSCPFRS
jgi:hypothetical protein